MSAGDDHPGRRVDRLLAGAGFAAGLGLLVRPGAVAAVVAPGFPRERLWIARVLGARLVGQHALVLTRPGPSTRRPAAAVDALHAVSMLPVLALPRYRRAALVTGGLAAASALAGRRSVRKAGSVRGSERR
jgi:hypothetical protein